MAKVKPGVYVVEYDLSERIIGLYEKHRISEDGIKENERPYELWEPIRRGSKCLILDQYLQSGQ